MKFSTFDMERASSVRGNMPSKSVSEGTLSIRGIKTPSSAADARVVTFTVIAQSRSFSDLMLNLIREQYSDFIRR